MLKLIAPLVVITGVIIAAVALYVAFAPGGSNLSSAGAGSYPTPIPANPGLIGQTPAPRPVKQKPANADAASKTLDSADALNAVEAIPGVSNAQVTLSVAGQLPDFQQVAGADYTSDYPIWVATATGTFHPSHGLPDGPVRTYTTATYYLDGYTGEPIGLMLR